MATPFARSGLPWAAKSVSTAVSALGTVAGSLGYHGEQAPTGVRLSTMGEY